MWEKIIRGRIKLSTILGLVSIVIALTSVTPALADFLGPDRTRTELVSSCQINLLQCQYVEAKDSWNYKVVSDWLCSNESKPWQSYPNSPSRDCSSAASGEKYWERDESWNEVTQTYPEATVRDTLKNCVLNHGWCTTPAQLNLIGIEPVSNYKIISIEGFLNGQNFACIGAKCIIPLPEGDNKFTFWALSSWGDSSVKGTLRAKVDSQLPEINGTLNGPAGSNGWFLGPVSFDGTASDATSGVSTFTCTLDGVLLDSCTSINVNSEGPHTLVASASDNAGHTNLLTQSLSIDTQPPALSASIQGTLGTNSWYNEARLLASATDPTPGSGISAIEYDLDNTGWTAFPDNGVLNLPDGKHDVSIRTVDTAGHSASAEKSFWLDSAPPAIAIDPRGTLGLNNWYVTSIDVSAEASDNTSGVEMFEYALNGSAWSPYTAPLILADGSHSVSFWAQDKAGLVKQVDQNYHIDTRAPQIAGSISGTPGINGWYVSEVILSASAADILPGSGVDLFTYNIDSAGEVSYVDPIIIPDGIHHIKLTVQDKAGLTFSTEQVISVDTVYPSLHVETVFLLWNKGKLTLNGTSNDSGSGISKIEVSTNAGKTWQAAAGTDSWSYEWDTTKGPDRIHTVLVRVTDKAGLATDQTLNVGVDNDSPMISLPASWLQWDTVTLDVWDEGSGLSEARIEIRDPDGRWPSRVIQLNLKQFPMQFKWDRRFGDNTIAPDGEYEVTVSAVDQLGNRTRKNASIKILIEILPPGPTSTSQPYSRIVSTPTPLPTATTILPTATSTIAVNTFGEIPATPQFTATPVATLEPRSTPTQTNIIDWLDSLFSFNTDTTNEAIQIESVGAAQPSPSGTQSNVLWGTVATTVVGVLSQYAAEERRRIEEEKARIMAEKMEEEERHDRKQEKKMDKLEQQWAQEKAWEDAREQAQLQKEQEAQDRRNDFMESKMDRIDAADEAKWLASQIIIEKREEEKKKQELKAGLEAYYSARKQGEAESAQPAPKNWWESVKSFIKDNILTPLKENVYEPVIEPIVQVTSEAVTKTISWADTTIYQPYIAPEVEEAKQFIEEELKWIEENIYTPYIQPAVEKTIDFVSEEISWINENIYQPYIEPALVSLNENVIQPYIVPAVNVVLENVAEGVTWIDENIYEPYIEPVVDYIDENVYQPVLAPVVNDVTGWFEDNWSQYSEYVHGALDIAGFIPGVGEIADGLNALIYLGEGRYIDAGTSAISLIPILGDLAKTGKWGIQLGEEVVEELTEKVVKEVTEELAEEIVEEVAEETVEEIVEQVVEEAAEEIIEEVAEETTEEIVEIAAKETLGEAAEKTLKESADEISSKVAAETLEAAIEKALKNELAEKTIKEAADETVSQVTKNAAEAVTATATQNVSEDIIENVVENVIKQVDDELISTLTEKYGADQVEKFLPACERYGIDPYDVLTNPPSEGQSLVGWVLGISDPKNPVNFDLAKMDLPQSELDRILKDCVVRPESDVVVLGYGKGCNIPYYELSNKIEACNISLSATDWAPFDQARANFWTDINAPFIEKAVDERKVFLFNINYDVITDIDNVERFSLPELRLIEMAGNNYSPVPMGEYVAFFPTEMLESGAEWPKEILKLGDLK